MHVEVTLEVLFIFFYFFFFFGGGGRLLSVLYMLCTIVTCRPTTKTSVVITERYIFIKMVVPARKHYNHIISKTIFSWGELIKSGPPINQCYVIVLCAHII